jgi:hypothetical protein
MLRSRVTFESAPGYNIPKKKLIVPSFITSSTAKCRLQEREFRSQIKIILSPYSLSKYIRQSLNTTLYLSITSAFNTGLTFIERNPL